MSEILKESVLLHHKRCNNTWLYTGKNPFVTSCSFCKGSVSIKANKIITRMQVPQQKFQDKIGDYHLSVVRVGSPEQHDDDVNHLRSSGKRGVLSDNRSRS
jgi:hypothetical protein